MKRHNGRTSVETPPVAGNPAAEAAEFAGDLTSDLVTLMELQGHLLRIDVKEATNRAYFPVTLLVLSLACLIGACPLGMLGLAWWLASATELSVAVSALIVAGIGFVIAALLGWWAWCRFGHSAAVLKRSREEFVKNINWLKGMLRR